MIFFAGNVIKAVDIMGSPSTIRALFILIKNSSTFNTNDRHGNKKYASKDFPLRGSI